MTDGDVGEVLRIERAGAVLDAFVVPWDSAALGVPAAQIRELSLPPATGGDRRDPDDQLADELLGAFDAWCREHDVRFAACRLDHLRIRESIALERADFRFVETTYEVGLDDLGIVATPAADVVIERVRPGDPDLAAAIAIAGSAFTTGRFAVDPRLDPAVNGRRYAAWVASSAAAERQIVLGARLLGEVVGFFVVEDVAADTVYWHLTAVAPAAQGRGIGRSLWQAMVARHRAAGARSIRTTISGHNLPVINLYARLGFRFVGSGQTLHRVWTADAAAGSPAEGRP